MNEQQQIRALAAALEASRAREADLRAALDYEPCMRKWVESQKGDPSAWAAYDCIEIDNDYVLTCAGSAYLAHTAAHGNGTHVLTVKGRKGTPEPAATSAPEETE